jgi:hypothetical protein
VQCFISTFETFEVGKNWGCAKSFTACKVFAMLKKDAETEHEQK